MNNKRLLEMIIENMLIGEQPETVIKYLYTIGFGAGDLIDLGFDDFNVARAIDEINENLYTPESYYPIFV